MKSVDEVMLENLQKDHALTSKQYVAAHNQYRHEINEGQKVLLKHNLEQFEAALKDLERRIAELKANLKYGWRDNLYKIDFDEADEALGPAIKHLKEPGAAALFLLKESRDMMGKYCVDRLSMEWLRKVNSTIVHIHILLEDTDEETILRKLAEKANLDADFPERLPDAQTILLKHCKSLKTGLLFFTLQFNDDLKHSPGFLSTFREKFLNQFIRILKNDCNDYGATQVVILLVAENDLNQASLDEDVCCSWKDFEPLRILHIPTERWDAGVIERWLTNHSGLTLTLDRERRLKIAAAVIEKNPNGLPRKVDTELLKVLKQHTEIQNAAIDQEQKS